MKGSSGSHWPSIAFRDFFKEREATELQGLHSHCYALRGCIHTLADPLRMMSPGVVQGGGLGLGGTVGMSSL